MYLHEIYHIRNNQNLIHLFENQKYYLTQKIITIILKSNANVKKVVYISEYFEVVENALTTYTPECVPQIRQANQMIIDLLKTTQGKNTIQAKFKYIIFLKYILAYYFVFYGICRLIVLDYVIL